MTTNNKITSRKELAIALSKGTVSLNDISVKLERIVDLWLGRKEIVLDGNLLKLS